METDYSVLTQADFEKVVQSYALFKLLGQDSSQSKAEGAADAEN